MNEENIAVAVSEDEAIITEPAPKPVRQRFVVNLPSDITQNDFQARLNGLGDPSLPVKAIWRVFLEKGSVSIRLRKG